MLLSDKSQLIQASGLELKQSLEEWFQVKFEFKKRFWENS